MSRPALVLIPGLMCDQRIWAAQCDALRGLGIEFRVADHGSADSLADMARAVLAANPGPLAVVGHSMGGRVALEIARLAGARLRGAALLDTGFRPLAPGDAGAREVAGRLRLAGGGRGGAGRGRGGGGRGGGGGAAGAGGSGAAAARPAPPPFSGRLFPGFG